MNQRPGSGAAPILVVKRAGHNGEGMSGDVENKYVDRKGITVEEGKMTSTENAGSGDPLRADKMTQLTELIQEFPAEAQLILAAVEDGLRFGPAQLMNVVDGGDHDNVTGPASGSAPAYGVAER